MEEEPQQPPSSPHKTDEKMASDGTLSTTCIDDLPDCLLLHIISFLPAIDAISSSSVSPRWRNLWHLIPTLDFSIFSFTYRLNRPQPAHDIRLQVAKFISRTLLRRLRIYSPLHELRLSFDYKDYDRYKRLIDFVIRSAIKSNCKVLSLNLAYVKYHHLDESTPCEEEIENIYEHDTDDEDGTKYDHYCTYIFSFSNLIRSSVEVLKLKGCEFYLPSVSITSLKSLHLVDFDGWCDNILISQLVSLCVNLESLYVHGLYGPGNLKIVSPKLKQLSLIFYRERDTAEKYVEICAPSLRIVSFDSFCAGKYIFQDTSSLVEASVKFSPLSFWKFACWSNLVTSLTGVECLTVSNMWIWYETLRELKSGPNQDDEIFADHPFYGEVPVSEDILSATFVFKKLKFLTLLTGYTKRHLIGLELCLELCPMLEYLDLEYFYGKDCDDDLTAGRPITLRMQNVRQVTMKSFRGTRNELYFAELLKRHQVVLEKIIALPADEEWRKLGFCVIL